MKRKGLRDGKRNLRHLMSGKLLASYASLLCGFWVNIRALWLGYGICVLQTIIFFIQSGRNLDARLKVYAVKMIVDVVDGH